MGANDHLLASFKDKTTGQPIGPYLERVRARFARWILDTARAEYDQQWLDYQHEIGLRHHRAKKNQTDGANAPAIVPFRDLFALTYGWLHSVSCRRHDCAGGRLLRRAVVKLTDCEPALAGPRGCALNSRP